MNGFRLVGTLCAGLIPGESGLEQACEALIQYGGIDTEKLTVPMLLDGLQDRDAANWGELRFSCNEVMFFFPIDPDLNDFPDRVCACAIALVILCHGVRRTGESLVDEERAQNVLGTIRPALAKAPAGIANELATYIHAAFAAR